MRFEHLDAVLSWWPVIWLGVTVYAKGVLAFSDLNERCNATCHTEQSVCLQVNGQLGGICICVKGYRATWNGRKCVPERCTLNEHCDLENEECNKSIARCVCQKHHERRYDSQPCQPPLGRQCTSAGDCLKFAKHTQCLNETCTCDEKYLATQDSTLCLPLLGSSCGSDIHCLVKHSLCKLGTCECRRGPNSFVASANGTVCLPEVSSLRMACSEHSQCVSDRSSRDGARWCVNNECVCRFGITTPDTKHCEAKRGLNDACTHTQQCQTVARSHCRGGKCKCEPGFSPHPTETICLSGLLGPCQSDEECFVPDDGEEQKTECQKGTCSCKPGYLSSDALRCSPQSAESASSVTYISSCAILISIAATLAPSIHLWQLVHWAS